ncbi:MAG: pilus assembly FimT family protein [Bacillota bacterium]
MRNKGFTLVELLVVIAVAGLLLAVVLSVLLSGFENFGLGSDRADRQSDIRLVESIIHNDLRNAMCVSIDTLGDLSCTGTQSKIELIDKAIYQGGRKVTGEFFTEIEFEIINENVFELTLEFDKREPYKIKMLLNNFSFDSTEVGQTKYLSNFDLEYKK